ncbi:hypothetical protein D9M71_469950 [compost metagenome]
MRAVDQDFGDAGIAQQHFKRTEAGQFVDDFLGQAFHLVARQGQVQSGDIVADLLHHELRQGRARAFEQVAPAVLDGVDDVTMQGTLEPLRVGPQIVPRAAEQFVTAHLCPHNRLSQLALTTGLPSERRASRSPSAFKCWVSCSRGASSNKVRPWFLAFRRTSGL